MVTRSFTTSRTESRTKYFWVPVTLLLLVLLPTQFYIGSLLMTPLRLFLLIMTPILTVKLLKGDFGKLVVPDYCMVLFCFWLALSIGYHRPAMVVTFAGSTGMLIFGGYLCGRGGIRNAADFRGLANIVMIIAAILMPMGIYEAVWHQPSLILTLLSDIPFFETYADSPYCCRLGMSRAQTVFIHPIHFGIYCAMGLAIFYLSNIGHLNPVIRVLGAIFVIAACVSSVSSGPLIMISFQTLMIGYAIVFYKMKLQWKLFLWTSLVGWILLELNTTKIAFFRLAEMLAFSPGNAYTRQIMIDVGIGLVKRFPLLGQGPGPWPLPHWMRYSSSIDNYWLVLAGAYGMPAFLAAMTAIVYGLVKAGGDRLKKGSDLYWCRLSWSFLMVSLMIALATVFVWASLLAVVYCMVGAGMFLIHANEPDAAEEPEAETSGRRPLVYTRFPDKRKGGRARPGALPTPAYARDRKA